MGSAWTATATAIVTVVAVTAASVASVVALSVVFAANDQQLPGSSRPREKRAFFKGLYDPRYCKDPLSRSNVDALFRFELTYSG